MMFLSLQELNWDFISLPLPLFSLTPLERSYTEMSLSLFFFFFMFFLSGGAHL